MKVLLHICCAPCSIECINNLRKEDIEVIGFWFNPNIHPFTEYKARLDGLKEYSKEIDLDVVYKDDYGLKKFVTNVISDLNSRCDYCYRVRLEETAKYAKENGFDAFTSTLLISPYQKHEIIKNIGYDLEKKYGIKFLYRDFREHFKEGQKRAREMEIYMQKYCGCIFSEEERYLGVK
ncbi:MAG: epoxyqueuosine reductase QueH [Bacilli bacterium]|nr:epoxyqueuosine reductase QueH [Bacilli bacterium]